jgi:hypothetical protein
VFAALLISPSSLPSFLLFFLIVYFFPLDIFFSFFFLSCTSSWKFPIFIRSPFSYSTIIEHSGLLISSHAYSLSLNCLSSAGLSILYDNRGLSFALRVS